MTILHMTNYLFSMIPIPLVDSMIHFLLAKQDTENQTSNPYPASSKLLPFITDQLQYIRKWSHLKQSDNLWTDVEQTWCKEIHISDFPFTSHSITHHPCFNNPTTATTLRAWWEFHQIKNTVILPGKHDYLKQPWLLNEQKTTITHIMDQ